ncbi:MAG: response regulator [Acidobacteriota bacterium]
MRLNIQSRIWPLLTLPILVACLALGLSQVVSINASRNASLNWAHCEQDLHQFGRQLWSYHGAYRAGDAARALEIRTKIVQSLKLLPESCIAPEELRRLADVTQIWLAGTASELASMSGPTPARSEASFNSMLSQFDLLSLRAARMKTEALSGQLAKRKDAVALSLLASLLAVMALLLNRTYRREMKQRQSVEEELRASEARYRELFEHVAEGVYQSSPSGEILRANPALVKMLGFDSEAEMKRVNVGNDLYCQPERRSELTAQLEREGNLRDVEYSLKRQDGSTLVVLENARAVRNSAGALQWYEGSLVDITARKRAEQDLATRMRELEQARKQSESQAYQMLEQSFELATARDQAVQGAGRQAQFLVNLSSEFRGPMNGVVGMAQLLLDSELSMQQREFAESVRRSSSRLLETIDDILEYSRMEGGELVLQNTPFSIRSVVADLIQRHAERAEAKGLEMAVLVKPDVPDQLTGDAGRIRQVLGHLIHNAIRMTDSGAVSVTIGTARKDTSKVLLRVQVEDSGAGIPTDLMPVLFDPFAGSVTPTQRGRERGGLNLAISRKLVERMGGQMGVESEPGQGSLFWFQVSLPYMAHPLLADPALELRGLRCLIVQEGVSVRGAIAETATGWGLQATTAGEAPDALKLLRQAELMGEPFDVLLVDNELPGLPGIALADSVLEDAGCGHPNIVLMVPYSQRAYCLEPTLLGISAMLSKPVEERALLACLLRVSSKTKPIDSHPGHGLIHLDRAVQSERPKAILLVEDDLIGQRVGKRLLEKLGYEVVVVANGLEAVQAVQEYQFAAVLMDMMMPEMDGCAATQAIRALESVNQSLAIIAMSASDATSDRERCLAAGMNDYICKPASLEQLRTIVSRWTESAEAAAAV